MKLSIITVNRNNAAGLERTIQSVLNQTFTDYEYLIVDGNSSDNSIEIVKQYATGITRWVSESDSGIYNAMNKGAKQAKGEYVIFMNSGDCFYDSDVLQKVFSTEHTADFIVGVAKKKFRWYTAPISAPAHLTFYFFWNRSLPHQATFTKRSLFDELGFYDEQLKIYADWKFSLLAILLYHKSVEIISDCIALMEMGGASDDPNIKERSKEEKDPILRTYFPYLYDDYKELHRWKILTFARWKQYFRWRYTMLIYKYNSFIK